MPGYVETGAAAQEMTAVQYAALPHDTRVEIWLATKAPTRHIRNGCLENASYIANCAALGPMHELFLRTIAIRSGLMLGVRPG